MGVKDLIKNPYSDLVSKPIKTPIPEKGKSVKIVKGKKAEVKKEIPKDEEKSGKSFIDLSSVTPKSLRFGPLAKLYTLIM